MALAASAGGWRRNCATTRITTPCRMPVATNVVRWPLDASSDEIQRDEQRRAAAEPGGHDAGGQAAPVLEPLERRADRAAVDEGGAGAGEAVEDIQHRQRRGVAHAGPADAAQQPGGADEAARAQTVDQPAVERLDHVWQRMKRVKANWMSESFQPVAQPASAGRTASRRIA